MRTSKLDEDVMRNGADDILYADLQRSVRLYDVGYLIELFSDLRLIDIRVDVILSPFRAALLSIGSPLACIGRGTGFR